MIHLPRSFKSFSTRTQGASGFTLIEIVVASVILAIVTSGTAMTLMSANRSVVQAEVLSRTSAAIDANASQILRQSEAFTCCAGFCTLDPAAIAAAGAKCTGSFGDANYYFPSSALADVADLTNFLRRCQPTTVTDGLVGPLITQVESTVPAPAGINRAIVPDPYSPLNSHRIRITFSGNGFTRVVKLVPTVAVWCP